MILSQPITAFVIHFWIFFSISVILTCFARFLSKFPRLAKRYLVQPERRSQQNINFRDYFNLIYTFIFNEWLITLPMNLILWWIYWGDRYEMKGTSYQGWIRVLFWEDVLFYVFHRLLHTSFLYKNVHSIHHRWTMPVALEAIYAHPLDHLMVNVFPVYVSPILAGLSYTEFVVWGILAGISGATSHSGIKFLNSEYHDKHHSVFNGNYGTFRFMDWLFRTEIKD